MSSLYQCSTGIVSPITQRTGSKVVVAERPHGWKERPQAAQRPLRLPLRSWSSTPLFPSSYGGLRRKHSLGWGRLPTHQLSPGQWAWNIRWGPYEGPCWVWTLMEGVSGAEVGRTRFCAVCSGINEPGSQAKWLKKFMLLFRYSNFSNSCALMVWSQLSLVSPRPLLPPESRT